ncbi:hypothetical protein D3C81_1756850 [compost metagenome]
MVNNVCFRIPALRTVRKNSLQVANLINFNRSPVGRNLMQIGMVAVQHFPAFQAFAAGIVSPLCTKEGLDKSHRHFFLAASRRTAKYIGMRYAILAEAALQ